jgi:hypothetical protein
MEPAFLKPNKDSSQADAGQRCRLFGSYHQCFFRADRALNGESGASALQEQALVCLNGEFSSLSSSHFNPSG